MSFENESTGMKGISPLVATVLLIAFVVAIAGIIATWLGGFAKSQTSLVGQQSTQSITCSYGSIDLKNVVFQSAGTNLAGTIANNGQISIGNVTLSLIYQNATSQQIGLCNSAASSVSCTTSNLSLTVGQQTTFNLTIWGSNYDSAKVFTNCTNVIDSVQRGDITAS